MAVQIVVAIVNIVLDWYMVFPLGWGVMGAALATSIACAVGGLMVLVYFLLLSSKLKFYRLKLSSTSLLLTLRNTGYMIKIGFATFLTELAMSVMMLTGNYMFISILGEAGVAAFAIACYLFPVVFSISNAVAQSTTPIISFNYGAHQMTRVGRALRVSLFTAVVCGVVVTGCLWIGATGIVRLFLNPQESAYGLAVDGLPLFALCAVFFAINIAFIGYYQSIEKASVSTLYTLLRGIFAFGAMFCFVAASVRCRRVWLAIPAAELLTCVVISLRYVRQNSVINRND